MTGIGEISAAGVSRPIPEDDWEEESLEESLPSLSPWETNVVAKQKYPDDQYVNAVVPPQGPAAAGNQADAQDVFADYAGKMVDFKGVGKFPSFTGEEADWPDWLFRFENCADLIDLTESMELAVKEKEPIDSARLYPKYAQRARLLYGVVVQTCSGRALSLLRLAPNKNGLEGWRQPMAEYEPSTASRATAMLAALLTPVWGQRPFLDELLDWERSIESYEAASGEAFAGRTRCAVVSRWALEPVRDFFRISDDNIVKDLYRLKAAIRGFYSRGVIYAGDGRTDVKGAKMHALTSITQGGATSSTASPPGISQNKKPWRAGKQQGGQQKQWGRSQQQQQRSQGAGKGGDKGKGQRCPNCGGSGHAARQCPTPRKPPQQGSQQQAGSRVIQCQRCQRWGHYARDCRAQAPNRMSALCDSALVSSLEQLALGPEIALLRTRWPPPQQQQRQQLLRGLELLDIEVWPIMFDQIEVRDAADAYVQVPEPCTSWRSMTATLTTTPTTAKLATTPTTATLASRTSSRIMSRAGCRATSR